MSGWLALSTLSNIEIEHWCEKPDDEKHYHLFMYMILGISATLFIGFRAYTLVTSGIKQGRTLHKKMTKSLLYAGLT